MKACKLLVVSLLLVSLSACQPQLLTKSDRIQFYFDEFKIDLRSKKFTICTLDRLSYPRYASGHPRFKGFSITPLILEGTYSVHPKLQEQCEKSYNTLKTAYLGMLEGDQEITDEEFTALSKVYIRERKLVSQKITEIQNDIDLAFKEYEQNKKERGSKGLDVAL